jgi:hypothetical protein
LTIGWELRGRIETEIGTCRLDLTGTLVDVKELETGEWITLLDARQAVLNGFSAVSDPSDNPTHKTKGTPLL